VVYSTGLSLKVNCHSKYVDKMRPSINVIRLHQVDILRQLHIEELLLRKTNKNFCILNVGQPVEPARSIVLGFSGKIHELLNVDLVKSEGVRVVRRYTGGGTVIVDKGTMFVSFVMNSADAGCKPYPREIMTWSADEIYCPAFNNVGFKDVFSLLENDYTVSNKKIAGNAQTITKNRWVHHTSFLWQFDAKNMELLQVL
jgi:lipoate-protein ligase A